ncbi:hypothetical protein BDFB_004034, partial [Asbolus verrucosus]
MDVKIFNGRKYVIIQEDVSNIFTSEELDHICNLLVIVPTNCFEKESYDLMTHLYRHKSRSREPEILDKWFSDNSSFLYGNNLFPDKLSDQNGRQLRIGTFTYEPYSIAGQDNKTMYGTEADFMSEFVKKHNFIPHYTIIGADLWGDIYDNWTGFGLFGSLVDDAVDIGYVPIVDDLAFSGLQWGATTDAWIFSMEKFEEENYVIIKNNFIVKEENDLEALSKKGNFGFAIERLPYGGILKMF